MVRSNSLIQRVGRTGVPLLLVRLVVGGLFIQMGYVKVADPVGFLKLLRLYEMLPETPAIFMNATAIVLPWLEVICGAALVLGVWVRGSAAIITAMLLVFTPVVFFRALGIREETGQAFCQIAFDCGCGGGPINICKKIVENTGMLLGSLIALFSNSRRFCLGGRSARNRSANLVAPSEPRP